MLHTGIQQRLFSDKRLAFNKADAYPGFSGLSDGENYRTHQTAFVEQAVSEAEAAEAAYFVHLSHIPISTETVPLRQNLKGIVDLLNDAADVSICGHTHHFRVESPRCGSISPLYSRGATRMPIPAVISAPFSPCPAAISPWKKSMHPAIYRKGSLCPDCFPDTLSGFRFCPLGLIHPAIGFRKSSLIKQTTRVTGGFVL